jgi:antitoxin component YwqK of YwqJK toxin-antitoxin module
MQTTIEKDEYGQYESKGNLVNGKLDGKWTLWRENGQIQIEANYKDGKKDGKYTYWWLNGQITVSNWKDGECISGDCD